MEYRTTHTGFVMPQIGLGTFALKAESVFAGIENGYTLLDTAWQYGNENEVGRAVRESGVEREDIIISTKLWTKDIRRERVREALEESLRNLGTEYVDIYLIHWPAEGYEKAWEEMARLKDEGKIKEVGVCNFHPHHFESIGKVSGIVPILNQIESHPYFRNDDLIGYCRKMGVLPQAWSPLGGSNSKLTADERFKAFAEKYGKTPTQVILRWHLQRDMMIIPRSSNSKRQKDNLDIYDFELDAGDMDIINGMETGRRFGADPDNFNF